MYMDTWITKVLVYTRDLEIGYYGKLGIYINLDMLLHYHGDIIPTAL